ncbi:hypothetical protein RRG08_014070 [Elysia crispata]|uniref:Uncharacterized protein n=1 Tax=Elysia crispata TaxID=231223 RepID=A0AAE1A001_9GAST|nr:hypothetical protein RRG08_014070 [Elysia crispata]
MKREIKAVMKVIDMEKGNWLHVQLSTSPSRLLPSHMYTLTIHFPEALDTNSLAKPSQHSPPPLLNKSSSLDNSPAQPCQNPDPYQSEYLTGPVRTM